jgi:hypothetical protein
MIPDRTISKVATLTLMHVLGPAGVFCLVCSLRLPEVAASNSVRGSGLLYLGAAIALHFARARWLA